MADIQYISGLLFKRFSEPLSAAEEEALAAWLQETEANQAFFDKINDEDELRKLVVAFYSGSRQRSEQRVLEQIQKAFPARKEKALKPAKRSLYRRFRLMAASIILLFVLGAAWYLSVHKKTAVNNITEASAKDIAAPVSSRAMITLANGSRVYLDSIGNGQLAQLGNIKLVKLANGKIAYQTADGRIIKELQYHTLSNPRGSKVIDMQLSDGTHVWLNAGSSITYPIAFVGGERKVTVKGEGYFEVAKDRSKPFRVTANGTTTEVLGTHFNLNAYDDEANTKITLLEGRVKVFNSNRQWVTIMPGQQARVTASEQQPVIVNQVDLDQVMAWKNGSFEFGEGMDIKEIMRQVARWYDAEVSYEGPVTQRFGGTITRDANVSEVLKKLELTGKVQFKIAGRKITVITQ